MTEQIDRARAFHALHVKGSPVVLYNAWDPGSEAQRTAEGGVPSNVRPLCAGEWSQRDHFYQRCIPLCLRKPRPAR